MKLTINVNIPRELKTLLLATTLGSLLYHAGVGWHSWLFWVAILSFWSIYAVLDLWDRRRDRES